MTIELSVAKNSLTQKFFHLAPYVATSLAPNYF